MFLPFGGASIVTTTFYDANSRIKRLVDDRGDVTDYEYDTLDRETVMRFHDGSTRVRAYDEAGDVIQFTDENGSVMENTFDALGRKTQCDITKAVGVVGTDAQSFEYDGLSRQTQAIDTVGGTDATLEMFYDSLNRVIEDSQTYTLGTQNVTTTAFASHPIRQLAFPNGRQIDNTHDLLYRRTDVSNTGGSTIAAWRFFGPSRVAELLLGNGLICTHMNNARTRSAIQENQTEEDWQGQVTPAWGDASSDRLGYDAARRIITKRYLSGGLNAMTFAYLDTEPVVGFTTALDRLGNKFFERHLHAESRSHLYEAFANGTPQGGYDSIDRLRQYQRGVLTSTGGKNNLGGGGIETPISLPNTDQSRTYDLDGLGNWRRTVYEPVGGTLTTEIRQHNSLNQITRRDSTPFAYDLNSNLLDDGTRLYTWDALNRLANVRRKSDGLLIGEYAYDATGRRIQKIVSNGGLSGTIPNGTTNYLYTGWQCVEECDGFGSPLKQYVWGIYIDELLQQRLLTTINNHGAGDYYPLSDLLYRTTALTDAAASIIETYDTDAYGNTLIFNAPGTGNNWWADNALRGELPTCDYIFTGRRYESDSQTYFYRLRRYLPTLGRFISRDVREYFEAMNVLQYCLGKPTVALDPMGTDIFDLWAKHQGEKIPKAVGVDVSFSAVAGVGAAYGFQAMFFPDSCEIGIYLIAPAIFKTGEKAIPKNASEFEKAMKAAKAFFVDLPWGLDISLSANVSKAVHTTGGAGTANASSWGGLFYGGTADVAVVGAGIFWDPTGSWIGGSVGAGPSLTIAKTNPQAYFLVNSFTLPTWLCCTLIAGI